MRKIDSFELAKQIVLPFVLRSHVTRTGPGSGSLWTLDSVGSAATTYCWLRSRHNVPAKLALRIARTQASLGINSGFDCCPYRNPNRWGEVGLQF